MKNFLKKIEHDLFDICSRLKQIDEGYEVYYNVRKKNFEVHNSAQRGSSYCLTLPYPVLDERSVFHVDKTRIENRNKLIAEMNRENLQLEKDVQDTQMKKLNEIIDKVSL